MTDYDSEYWKGIADDLDNSDSSLSRWECGFLDTILGWNGDLSPKQIAVLAKMQDKYL